MDTAISHLQPLDLAPAKPWRRFVPGWLRALLWVDAASHYDAFLSYSWSADSRLAPVIQSVIQQFLCPWYRLRAKTVFRDLSCMPAGSSLEAELFDRIDRSDHFIVLASPAASASAGMSLEAAHWFRKPRQGHLLIIVTEGNHQTWEGIRSNLLPPPLRENIQAEPLWVPLQHRRQDIHDNPTNAKLRDELAEDLKQVLLRFYPDSDWGQLRGEERDQRRRALRLISVLAIVFMVLASAAGTFAWYAVQQQRLALQQQHLAESRQMAAQSQLLAGYDPPSALSLAIEAAQRYPSEEAQAALGRVLEAPLVRLVLNHEGAVNAVAFSKDGKMVATASEDQTARVWDVANGTLLATLRGHSGGIRTVKFSPDGTRIATGAVRGVSKIWEIATATDLFTFEAVWTPDFEEEEKKLRDVNVIEFSPDGSRIVTAYEDGYGDLWDAKSGKRIQNLTICEESTAGAVFSPDSKSFITWGSQCPYVTAWDSATGVARRSIGRDNPFDWRQQGSAATRGVQEAVFTPDGKQLLVLMWEDKSAFWDPGTARELKPFAENMLFDIQQAVYSPDGSKIAVTSGDSAISIWNARTLQREKSLTGHTNTINHVAFTADGTRLLTASADNSVRIWDISNVEDASLLVALGGGPSTLAHVAFAHDGSSIVTTSGQNTAFVWDTKRTHPLGVFGLNNEHRAGMFLPDGRVVTCSVKHTCELWSTDGVKTVATSMVPERRPRETLLSPDGQRLVIVEDKTVSTWHPATGHLIAKLEDLECYREQTFSKDLRQMFCVDSTHQGAAIFDLERGTRLVHLTGHESYIQSAVFSPDGTRAVTASDDKTVRVWDVTTGRQITALLHYEAVSEAEFTPDSGDVLTLDYERVMRRWSVTEAKVRYTLNEKFDSGFFRFSPDGSRAIRITDGALTHEAVIFNVNTGEVIAKLELPDAYVAFASFSPDGKRIFIASHHRSARVWDAETGKLQGELIGHTVELTDAEFSPDGQFVATSDGDGIIKLWNVTTRRALITFNPGSRIESIVFSPDGKRLLATGEDGASLYPADLSELLRWAISLVPKNCC